MVVELTIVKENAFIEETVVQAKGKVHHNNNGKRIVERVGNIELISMYVDNNDDGTSSSKEELLVNAELCLNLLSSGNLCVGLYLVRLMETILYVSESRYSTPGTILLCR